MLATFEQKEYCVGLFLDVGQAFDKVCHDGFFFKMKALKDQSSGVKDIKTGVPQGSALGLVLGRSPKNEQSSAALSPARLPPPAVTVRG